MWSLWTPWRSFKGSFDNTILNPNWCRLCKCKSELNHWSFCSSSVILTRLFWKKTTSTTEWKNDSDHNILWSLLQHLSQPLFQHQRYHPIRINWSLLPNGPIYNEHNKCNFKDTENSLLNTLEEICWLEVWSHKNKLFQDYNAAHITIKTHAFCNL